jgi:hypothetical protein
MDDNHDNPIIIRPHIAFTDGRQRQRNQNTTTYCVYWLYGRVMIGMLFSFVSEHNMWSCYDWVVVVVFRLLTQYVVVNDKPIIIRPHIVLTDVRQRQPNHNTTAYCVYWRTTTNDNPLFSSVSEHNMWSCYDWVVVVVFRLLTQYVVVLWLGCRYLPSVNTIFGGIMIGLSLSTHCIFTDGRQLQPNHNATTYCVYWRKITTTQS